MRPICGRFAVSRSPADPNTAMSPPPRAAAVGVSRSSTVRRDAGLWAKSMTTPNGWPASTRSIRPGTAVTEAIPRRIASGSSDSASPSATTARALWTLNRPASLRSSRPPPDGVTRSMPRPSGILRDVGRADVGGGVGAVRQDRGPRIAGDADEGARRRVVEVDDADPWTCRRRAGSTGVPTAAQAGKERQLRVAIRLPRAVELEVLVGQVGDDGDVVVDRADPFEGEAVRRGLDDRGGVAGVDHAPKRGLQLRRLGRRRVDGVILGQATDPRRDRPDHPRSHPGSLERRDREVRGRRLAIRAGDADDPQVA